MGRLALSHLSKRSLCLCGRRGPSARDQAQGNIAHHALRRHMLQFGDDAPIQTRMVDISLSHALPRKCAAPRIENTDAASARGRRCPRRRADVSGFSAETVLEAVDRTFGDVVRAI